MKHLQELSSTSVISATAGAQCSRTFVISVVVVIYVTQTHLFYFIFILHIIPVVVYVRLSRLILSNSLFKFFISKTQTPQTKEI